MLVVSIQAGVGAGRGLGPGGSPFSIPSPPDLFVGQLKSSLTCSECGYCSTAFDPFWDLSLPIPKVRCPHSSLSPCPTQCVP